MCQLSAFLICLWIMTNVWLTLPDWIWLFIEFNLQFICVHLFASELAEEKRKERAWDLGEALHLLSLLSCENLIWNENVFVLSYSIRYIQNCQLESCFPSAGDSVNILLACTSCSRVHGRKGVSVWRERDLNVQLKLLLQKVPIFRGSGWGFPGGLIHIWVCVRSFSVELGSEGSQINGDAQRPKCPFGL